MAGFQALNQSVALFKEAELIGFGSLQRGRSSELRIAAELMLQQTCLSILKDGD
jgi:hypothetical protein